MKYLTSAVVAILSGLLLSIASQSTTHADSPIVIAHRGASGYLPEHTLAAKSLAVGQGADFIEQDVVLTKDGVPIVSHDIHLDTVTDVAQRFPDRHREDGRYYAIDLTFAEVKQLSVNERVNLKTNLPAQATRFPAGSTALRINSLEEELRFLAGLSHSSGRSIGVYPEIKRPSWHRENGQDISAVVIKTLQQNGFSSKADACWLQCFEWPEVRRIRTELNWAGRLVQLFGKNPLNTDEGKLLLSDEGLQQLAKTADAIGPELSSIIEGTTADNRQVSDLVSRAHAAGLKVHPYTIRSDALPPTVRSLEDLQTLLFADAKVDGAFTDFPDQLVTFLRSHQIEVTQLHPLETIALWPNVPPGQIAAKGDERDTSNADSRTVEGRWVVRLGDVSKPTLTLYPAGKEENSGATVLVCPGGGYNILAWDLEGSEVCQWLNSIGVNAALLKYRVPRVDNAQIPIEPLQDAQRALSLLRSRAAEWALDPDRIGVLGFSAGGHLSARVSTRYNDRAYDAIDSIDSVSCRPDFALLIYPAYLFDKKSEELVSPDLPVNEQTPPMFLTMAWDDPIDPENILRMATALKRSKVACEVHLYPTGGHGYGLRRNPHEATSWPDRAAEWMSSQGLLKRSE